MKYTDGLIENSVLFDTAISGKENPNSLFFHYFYGVVNENGHNNVLKLTVEELKNPTKDTERRACKLVDIEKYQPSGVGSVKNNNLTSSQAADTIKTIADLYSFVKKYDKNFVAGKHVNTNLLNEDGTPKVFYHGSNKYFTCCF